jgi:hypothetical protein
MYLAFNPDPLLQGFPSLESDSLAVLLLIMFWRGWQGSIVDVKEAACAVISWQLLGTIGIGAFKALDVRLIDNRIDNRDP